MVRKIGKNPQEQLKFEKMKFRAKSKSKRILSDKIIKNEQTTIQ